MAFYTKALICYSSLLDWLAVNVEFTCPPHHVLCMHFLATHHWSECLHSELFSEFNHARLRAGGHCMSSYTTYVTTDYLSRTHSQSRMMCTCMASGLMTKENEWMVAWNWTIIQWLLQEVYIHCEPLYRQRNGCSVSGTIHPSND